MRTDSPSLTDVTAGEVSQAVEAIWGSDYLAAAPNLYK